MPSRLRPPSWLVGVFTLALVARLLYLFLADEPLAYSHPYNYFGGGLSLVEHPHPWRFILRSDRWHQWLGPWTIAPLYHLFVAGVFAVLGPHLLPLQLLQCGLDALCAVLVSLLARDIGGRWAVWAGVAYALNFHAIEQCCTTLTENLHTPLLLAGLALLAREARSGRNVKRLATAGVLLGLSGLARSVSTAFVPIAALWRWRVGRDVRAGLIVLLAGAGAILPWTARNVFLIGDLVPVESIAAYNLWDDNAFAEGDRRRRQEEAIASQPTLAAQRAQALKFAWRGVVRNPEKFAQKVWANLLHFVRPDGLHLLLRVEHSQPVWRHLALLVLDDAIVLPTVVLFAVFLGAGRPSPIRTLIGLWAAYYLLMVVVVFHNEIRYRSTLLPFALAGAAGGVALLADPLGRRRPRTWLALALGALLAAGVSVPYVPQGWRAALSSKALLGSERALLRGDLDTAERLAADGARQDPQSARPLLRYGRALAHAGRWEEATEAYRRARERKDHVWVPRLVLPRLLEEAGRFEEAQGALREAHEFSWHVDPWQALEVAWRELPPPRTDEILLGRSDYGAIKGFFEPKGNHRWSRHRAYLRLIPKRAAAAYDITLEMGSPPPSPLGEPTVEVWVEGCAPTRFSLGRSVATYTLKAVVPGEETLIVGIRSPTWNRAGQPAEQGIRVDRMTVRPAS